MALTIVDLTAGPDDPPKVEVLLTGLDSSVASVTAYRISSGVTERVRGVINASVSGAGSWVDFEVPAQQATYRVEYFDSAGDTLGFSEDAEIELGFAGCWMHNPLAPTGAVKVELSDSAGASLSRPVPGEILYPRGRRAGVIVSGPRRGLMGGVFDVYTRDFRTADRVQAFLGGPGADLPPVICIRPGVDHRIRLGRSPLFLGVLDIAEEGLDVRWGGDTIVQRIQGDEVSPPAPGLFIPLLRRKDVNAFYASREAFNAAYLTRLDANRDYSLAGYSA